MPRADRRLTLDFCIADALGVRLTGDALLLRPFERFFGPMRGSMPTGPQLDVLITPMQAPCTRHVFNQRYARGRWCIGTDDLMTDTIQVTLAIDRLGRVMAAPAGLGSLIRWCLGKMGFAWLHAAVLVRSQDEALVLAGPSGVGKSQLTLRAIASGWRYVTDDHALLHPRGLTGLTTPILLRGYGGWPGTSTQPAALRLKRLATRMLHSATGQRINLMLAHTPRQASLLASPAPMRRQTTVCLLEPGRSTTTRGMPHDGIADRLFDLSRHAGRFLDDLAAGYQGPANPIDPDAFWAEQRRIINRSLIGCTCFTATVPKPIDDDTAGALLALLGLGAKGGARG